MKQKTSTVTNWEVMSQQVQFYRDHLDIFIQEQFKPIKLTRSQHIIARQFGRCDDMKVVCSRGYGKTWLTAVCCFAVCCLYPQTLVAVTSGTAPQATLTIGKIKELVDSNKNMAAQLVSNGARNLVRLQKDHGVCEFKNGSKIESYAMDSLRGSRAKIVVVDEALIMSQDDLDAILSPLKNFRRPISRTYDFEDYPSKSISISSASQKSNSMYDDFMRITREMAKGNPGAFSCAFDYKTAIADGITDAQFFEKERARMPQQTFDMEYGSIFVGSNSNSAFPYQLTDGCRTLKQVQMEQPKQTKSRYVIGVDIATSEAKTADNTIISAVKFTERNDGSFAKKLVYIRSYKGMKLDALSRQIRIAYHRQFPNCERIVYDRRGLGDGLDRFLDASWTDPETNKEYPPLVNDDTNNFSKTALAVLHPVAAVQAFNSRVYTNMRVSLEKRSLQLPINSRLIRNGKLISDDDEKKYNTKELAIFQQTDALQFEMGNIVAKIGASGNVLYDTPRITLHKDRYSSVAYALDYICELEKENIKRKASGPPCIGFATNY